VNASAHPASASKVGADPRRRPRYPGGPTESRHQCHTRNDCCGGGLPRASLPRGLVTPSGLEKGPDVTGPAALDSRDDALPRPR
jgi:hypothetical protein